MPLTLDRSRISLQVGVWERLLASEMATWSSDNPNVYVDQDGWVIALRDVVRPDGKAVITATTGVDTATCEVTIVNWQANRFNLVLEEKLLPYRCMAKHDGYIYAGLPDQTFWRTNDGFRTVEQLSNLPRVPERPPLLFTPHGTFFRGGTQIFRSLDLVTWTLSKGGLIAGLYHSFDYWHDESSNTTYIYASEYSTNANNRHKVWRGTITDSSETWDIILDFPSRNESPTEELYCWHVHTVQVDPYTGNVFVGTGDFNPECHILMSEDNGNTFRLLGTGSQDWRLLSFWFTNDYIYWNVDSDIPQSLWRIARSDLLLQSPENDLKERVALLDNGSHWYHCWAKDDRGQDIVVMGSAAEGKIRDDNGRVYVFNENTHTAEEVFLVPPHDLSYIYVQLEPNLYNDGYVYLRNRGVESLANPFLEDKVWKMKLTRRVKPKRLRWRKSFVFRNPNFV